MHPKEIILASVFGVLFYGTFVFVALHTPLYNFQPSWIFDNYSNSGGIWPYKVFPFLNDSVKFLIPALLVASAIVFSEWRSPIGMAIVATVVLLACEYWYLLLPNSWQYAFSTSNSAFNFLLHMLGLPVIVWLLSKRTESA